TLVRPTFQLAPILAGAALLFSDRARRIAIPAGVVMALSSMLVIAPWILRNYNRFHEVGPVSSNFGLTLLSSNHPDSDGIYMETRQIGVELTPISQDKLQRKLALEYIAANPSLFVSRTAKRIVYMWGGETSIPDTAYGPDPPFSDEVRQLLRASVQLFWAAFVAACCFGALRLLKTWTFEEVPVVWASLVILLAFCVHALLEPAARHHMALLPLLAGLYLPGYSLWLNERHAHDSQSGAAGNGSKS
ncbi:MAG: hypothetical protein H7039_09510, partial [Bryobacteraceae bacterium]|nr:hypothetical protein [Bryobacteraceae bacterium]